VACVTLGALFFASMADLIWIHDEESPSPTEYADHGHFRAMIVRHDESEGRTTIRYFIRDLDKNVDERASHVQIQTTRADQVIEGLKANLERELTSRAPDVADDEP